VGDASQGHRPIVGQRRRAKRQEDGGMKWLKGLGIAVGVLVLAVLAAAVAGWQMADVREHRQVAVNVQPVADATGPDSLQRGRYLFDSRGCAECHGANGGGRTFVEKGQLKIAGPNITAGGVTAKYANVDWVRTIRHGVKPDGTPVRVMPSEDFNRLTDADVAALVAHVRSLPARGGGEAVVQLPLPVRVLYGFGQIPDAASKIDHSLPPAQPVSVAVNVQHGAYVGAMCQGCHGAGLSGGKIPGGPPDWPPAANLTPGEGSVMGRYPDAQAFKAMLRSGKRPDGSAIQVMPFDSLSKLNDVDAEALHAFVRSLPPRPAGNR
jgi:mono/diheme cytochrome c family protein